MKSKAVEQPRLERRPLYAPSVACQHKSLSRFGLW